MLSEEILGGIFWRSKWTWLNWSLSNNDQNEVDFWVEYFYDLNIESWTGFPFDPWKAVSCDSGCELTHFDLIGRDSRFKLSVVRNTVFQIGYFKSLSLLKEVCARTLFNESLFELDSRVCLIAWAVKFIDQRENMNWLILFLVLLTNSNGDATDCNPFVIAG